LSILLNAALMSSPANQSLINLLLESGVLRLKKRHNWREPERRFVGEPGARFRQVDEQRFLGAIGNFFRVPVTRRREKDRSRDLIGFTEPFCFSTSHFARRGEGKFGRTGDIRSFQFHWPPASRRSF
jgi:hypothetical protein